MSQTDFGEVTNALKALGFTDLEALVYCYLVENSPATPYRVARDIGKPVANTYKAVEILFQKGMILVDDTSSRSCQAVAPEAVLAKLQRSLADRIENAAEAMARLTPVMTSESIFSLATADQVFDRCSEMAEGAESVILVDAYPRVVERIRPWLDAAAERGVPVILQAYEPTQLGKVKVVEFRSAAKMLERWSGSWLVMVVDGSEYLFAYIGEDGRSVHNAIWCGSAFLALPQHSNLALALRGSLLENLIRDGASATELQGTLDETADWLKAGEPGYSELTGKFADQKTDERQRQTGRATT